MKTEVISVAGDAVVRRREMWSSASYGDLEMATFGELKEGDSFIAEPIPGDNRGHGGLKTPHYLFKKIHDVTLEALVEGRRGANGVAIRIKDGNQSIFSNDTSVVPVEL